MWNPEIQRQRMKPAVDKLLAALSREGIGFRAEDELGMNVVLSHTDGTTILISHHSFYRYSGIAVVVKDRGEGAPVEIIPVTDEMFMMSFMRPVILAMMEGKRKGSPVPA